MSALVGGLIVLGGVGTFIARHFALDKVYDLQTATLRTVAELTSMSKEIAGDIGAGSYNEVVEVAGTLACSRPLMSELGQRPCLHYKYTVTREYEETRRVRDQQGNERTETHRGSDVLNSFEQTVSEFVVRDQTGEITVEPNGADFTTQQTVSRFEPDGMMSVEIGSFRLNLGQISLGHGRRLLGHRFEEWIVPVDMQGFVVGEANDAGGRMSIKKPTTKGARFIVSSGSKDALVKSTQSTANILKYVSFALWAVGAIVTALSVLS